MRRFSGKCALSVAAALAGIMVFGAGAASAATCGASGGAYTFSASTTVGGNLYCAYSGSANTNDWVGAEAFAVSIGGTLASIDDSTVAAALSTLVAGLTDPTTNAFGQTKLGPLAWTGLSTNGTDLNFGFYHVKVSDFKWVNGDASTYWQTSTLWMGGDVGGVNGYFCSPGSCTELYTFLDGAGTVGSWASITPDNPSLSIGALVEYAGGATPIPSAVWLFGTVLAGSAGVTSWRKRKSVQAAA